MTPDGRRNKDVTMTTAINWIDLEKKKKKKKETGHKAGIGRSEREIGEIHYEMFTSWSSLWGKLFLHFVVLFSVGCSELYRWCI
jgi:hypothetical protein